MGQAFRRAAGKLGSANIETSSSRHQNSFDRKPPAVPTDNTVQLHEKETNLDGNSKSNAKKSEARDPDYEAMLNQMVGRISTKPGGKLEMGEGFIVRKSNRPMPKVRHTTPDAGRYEERPVAAGTLNVAQLRHIMHLHQGNADEHAGPMGLKEIAERFRLDAVQLERIFQFVSLPPEDTGNRRHELNG